MEINVGVGKRKRSVKIRWIVLTAIICFLVAGVIYILSPFPKSDVKTSGLPDKFAVPIDTGFERQGKNQCAAFSTAFVLRNVGIAAEGSEVYTQIPYKIPISGYVLPKGIASYLESQGIKANIFKGTLESLKSRLVQRTEPIIVLVGNGLLWQHYMTLVGYDSEKQEMYFFDSGRDGDENGELPGNRTMAEDYFAKWWDNGLPVFNHVYITVESKE